MKRLYYCDHYAIPLPAGHKFPMRKYGLVRAALAGDGFDFVQAALARRETIALAHDISYVDRFLGAMLDPAMIRRIGFPWSENLVRRTLASVGGTLAATEDALVSGWGGNLAGGTHHAFRAEGSGFCVFNDIAVAIQLLRAERRIRRAAVIDLDVHQGDGTAQIFAGDADVFTLSLHGENNFPFRKQRSTIDIPLPDRTNADDYVSALRNVLPRVFEFRPEIVFYQSGVDGLATDTLGRLSLSLSGLAVRDRMVFEAVREAGVPVVVTLGGGYSNPLEDTVAAHANTYRTAAACICALPSHQSVEQ